MVADDLDDNHTTHDEDAAGFFNLYAHNFVRVAAAVPRCRVADPAFNARAHVELLERAAKERAAVVAFPELGLSAYTCDDLFHQHSLLDAALAALETVRRASERVETVAVLGCPLLIEHLLYNCAVLLHRGRVLGVVPKVHLPNYREFYEQRYFAPAASLNVGEITLLGQPGVPVGDRLLFDLADTSAPAGRETAAAPCRLNVEICEDLWVPLPPSSFAALAGATVLINLSASNITVGKAEYRHRLVRSQSARCFAAYLYTAAGTGESSTDLSFDGQAIIYENDLLLAETQRFEDEPQLITADVDLDRLTASRMRENSFDTSRQLHRDELRRFRTVEVPVRWPRRERLLLKREVERFPYVPSEAALREVRCYEAYNIQVQALAKRLSASGINKAVIGVSGGLDSTHALIVTCKALDKLGLPRTNVLAYTLPGFATSERTRQNAWKLMHALGVSAAEIDIRPSALQMLTDLDHPYAHGEKVYDVTFENVQAGERTSHLFRLANHHGGLVVGTGDLSELALGWATYGVGDQMSHYAVNVSIPKTLIQYLIRWVAETNQLGEGTREVLLDVLDTEISPELVPAEEETRAGEGEQSQPAQRTEDVIGPYELQDFTLYHTTRLGYGPRKIAFLAWHAWHDASRGMWPDVPEVRRQSYDLGEIKRWLKVFAWRFFKTSQFKRTCIPNGPKVGHGGSLSPRSDWRAPSDSEATAWLAEVETIPVDENERD